MRQFLRHGQFPNTWIAVDVDKGHDYCSSDVVLKGNSIEIIVGRKHRVFRGI